MQTTLILAAAALLTACLSAIIGMGGGMLLLAVMFSFMSHGEAIPTHAVVQLASNGTRTIAFIRHVDWRVLRRFCVGLFPGAAIGAALLYRLGEPGPLEPYFKAGVGVFILTMTYLPRRAPGAAEEDGRRFRAVGLLAGTAALTVGAIGPLIAPAFARAGFVKERLIATKAMCQMVTHVTKIPVFLLIRPDLPLSKLGATALAMIVVVIPGTLLGKRLLRHVSERNFTVLYRVALTAAGLKVLLIDGVWALVTAGQ